MCHSVYWPESNNEHKLKPTIQSCYPPNRSGEKHLCVCKHGRMPVRVCLFVCLRVLKGPCGVGTSGLISRHLLFAQIPLSHAVCVHLTLFLSLFGPLSCCLHRTQEKTSGATVLHK